MASTLPLGSSEHVYRRYLWECSSWRDIFIYVWTLVNRFRARGAELAWMQSVRIMLTQTYKYYQRFKRDPFMVKLVVVTTWHSLLNTASVFFVGHAAWYYLVTTGPGTVPSDHNVRVIRNVSGLPISGHNYWLTGILVSARSCCSGEVAAIELLLLRSLANFHSVKVPTILRLSSAAVCDTAIAISLSYFLHKKRTGFKRSDEAINHLILFSINSGLLTSVTSIASLITYLVIPRAWVYTALCFLISRLYATTFLCSLNSRQILMQNVHDDEKHTPFKITPKFLPKRSNWSVRRSGSGGNGNSPTQIDVFVVTETVTDIPQAMGAAKIRNSNTHMKD
ncbi:hypothetical protein BDZ97DRAFT_1754216 [Flammula alnicola]|nr:hypothetical protein BDZ97DRAFT_1754216 [Flammula alnicola]